MLIGTLALMTPAYARVVQVLELPDPLAENLELWRHGLPGYYDLDFDSFFSVGTYHAVLMGKRVYETDYASEAMRRKRGLNREIWGKYLNHVRGNIKQIHNHVADHKMLLRDLRGELETFAPAAATVAVPGMPLPSIKPIMPAPKAEPEPVSDDDVSIL